MEDDEDILFREAMADVAPLRKTRRVALRKSAADSATLAERRRSASAAEAPANPLASEGITPRDPWYVLSFKRPGVQHGVFRKLKQGRYEAEARLDLHSMGLERARRELFEFVRQAEELGVRSALVVHGKGRNSRAGQPSSIVKGGVDRWLRELEPVQAFHSARPQHGGTGAVYVLLRKNEQQKRKNRERFSG